jgi:hypothetical protein
MRHFYFLRDNAWTVVCGHCLKVGESTVDRVGSIHDAETEEEKPVVCARCGATRGQPENLDALDVVDLHQEAKRSEAPFSYRHYADRAVSARQHRWCGNIQDALAQEAEMDRIFKDIPPEWQW